MQSQVSRRVRNARRRLDQLDRDQVRRPPDPLRFDGTLGVGASGPAAALRGIRVPGRLALTALDVGATDRVLGTGANGSGKSTLLAVLAGRLRAQGSVRRRRGLRVGLLAQYVDLPDPDRASREYYGERAVPLRDLGLIAPRDIDRPVVLSVVQRRRVELAVVAGHDRWLRRRWAGREVTLRYLRC